MQLDQGQPQLVETALQLGQHPLRVVGVHRGIAEEAIGVGAHGSGGHVVAARHVGPTGRDRADPGLLHAQAIHDGHHRGGVGTGDVKVKVGAQVGVGVDDAHAGLLQRQPRLDHSDPVHVASFAHGAPSPSNRTRDSRRSRLPWAMAARSACGASV